VQLAANTHDGKRADLQVEIGSIVTGSDTKQIVNFQGHEISCEPLGLTKKVGF
jgi:hypothetical protein